MSKNLKRLMIAASISATGFASTLGWYRLTEKSVKDLNSSRPIARLVSTLNEVQKKSVKRIIWQTANDNEVLHVGEALRTTSHAEARIEFLNSSTAIDLEPDSAIVLEESNGKLSLDFLKGNIIVKSDNTAGSADSTITLKSGNKQIALGKSELSLGKSKSGDTNMNIISGTVNGENANVNQVKLLNFNAGTALYANADGSETNFEWEPLPKGYQVYLEAGLQRDDVKPIPGAVGDGESGKLTTSMKLGKNYFKLVARSKDPLLPEKSSSVMKVNVVAKIPPQPLSPEQDAALVIGPSNPKIKFLWSNPANFSKMILEIATTPDLKKIIKTEYLEHTTSYSFENPDKSATYYWRISGVTDGHNEVVSSKVNKFKLNVLNEILAPELNIPKDQEKIQQDTLVRLSWKTSPGALRYHIQIFSVDQNLNARLPATQNLVDESEVQLLQYSVSKLRAGEYSWSVASIGSKNETSKPSSPRTFTIQTLPVLNWADGKTQEDFYYLTLKPSATLKWEKGDAKATEWQVKIFKSEHDDKPLVKKTNTIGADIELPQDGSYIAEVEALDDKMNVVARSSKRIVNIKPAPLLPAPQFSAEVPHEIEATGSGNASVKWTQVEGANKYLMKIKSKNGDHDKELTVASAEGSVLGLMPGEYKLSLRSVDVNGRVGPEGETRLLKVPNQSNMRAPKLRGVKFK